MIVTGIALSLHFQHHLEISTGGMLQEMESLEFVGLSKSVPLKNPSFIVIRTQLLESHFCHPISVDPLGHRPKWHLRVPAWSNPVPEISSCRNSSEVMVIKGQKDGFWGVTFLDKSQIFGDPVKVFNISILSIEPTLTTSCQDWITVNYFAVHGCRFH